MKKLVLSYFLFVASVLYAQKDAFTTEISNQNGVVFFEGVPLSGNLYEYNDNGNSACSCLLKSEYKYGKLDGKTQSWYSDGKKKFAGQYKNGLEESVHVNWDYQGVKKTEKTFIKGKLIDEKNYFSTGELAVHNKFSSENSQEPWHTKSFYEGGTVKSEIFFKEGKKDGNYLQNYQNGNPHKRIKYRLGKTIEKQVYDEQGKITESLKPLPNSNLIEHYYYDNSNGIGQSIKGYYTQEGEKDSLWTTFNKNNIRILERHYNRGNLISEGGFVNNKKEGIWKEFHEDGVGQTNTLYNSGVVGETKTFNKNHLWNNHFSETDDVLTLKYKRIDGVEENICITSDRPFTKDRDEQLILGNIARAFMEITQPINKQYIDDNTLVAKKIHISNMSITYTTANIQNRVSKKYVKTYDAFIHFTLSLKDADGQYIYAKKHKFNRSQKLLNSLLNTTTQGYATDKNQAFNSALKAIKFKSLFKKHFPVAKK